MRRLFPIALVLAGCGSQPPDDRPRVERVIIDISGKVQIHPFETELRALDESLGAAPALGGATIDIESALDAVAGKPPLASGTVGADGTFSMKQVDVTDYQLAIVASVRDAAGLLMPSGYGLSREKPKGALADKPVYVLSKAFVQRLGQATAKGEPSWTGDDLIENGFVFGRFVDREGKGVAGVKLAKLSPSAKVVESSEDSPLWYLDADLTGVTTDGKSSASGLFVYLPPFGTAEYTGLADGKTFGKHLSGSRAKTATNVIFTLEE